VRFRKISTFTWRSFRAVAVVLVVANPLAAHSISYVPGEGAESANLPWPSVSAAISGNEPGPLAKNTLAPVTGLPSAERTMPEIKLGLVKTSHYAFHATMLLNTGLTIRVPELLVAPP
jgi:hypothetical protein